MSMLRYDEPANVAHLRHLSTKLRVVFALLCAARLLPSYARFHARTGRGDPEALDALAERLWEDASGHEMPSEEVKQAVARATQLVPNEDDGWDEETQPYAEDAAAALSYALRTRLSGDPQEAAWAARRVYEATDHFAIAANGGGAEEDALSNPIVQAELTRQQRDLNELMRIGSGTTSGHLLQMRKRSEHEAEIFFHHAGR